MGLYKTSNVSIFTFIYAGDLKFCTWNLTAAMEKVCKMMTFHFRTLCYYTVQ